MGRSETLTFKGRVRIIVLAMVATLIVLELLLRLATPRLSGNLAHVAQIPQIVAEAGGQEGGSVLLLGNSLTNNGMDPSRLSDLLPGVHFAKITPDATGLWDWQCILRRHLVEGEHRSIRTVVIGSAWHLLSDQAAVDSSRLGALFCRTGDLLVEGRTGVRNSGQLGEFLVAKASHLYALRDTIRNRLFSLVIPNYQRFASEDNAARAGRSSPSSSEPLFSYGVLSSLASDLRSKGVRLVIVAMPVQEPYPLDVGLLALSASDAIDVLDYRSLEGISARSFLDGIHLGPGGSDILSARLARDLAVLGTAP